MGGELIARIIEDAEQLKMAGIRLILQPMTKQEYLRRYLASAGFSIIDERFSYDSGKYYVTMLAEYKDAPTILSNSVAELGLDLPHDTDRVEYLGFLDGKRRALLKAVAGKKEGGIDALEDEERLGLIEKRMLKLKEQQRGLL